jgi:hypothetical protein
VNVCACENESKMRVRESHGEIWGENWVVWNEARSGFTCGGVSFLKNISSLFLFLVFQKFGRYIYPFQKYIFYHTSFNITVKIIYIHTTLSDAR